MLHGIIIAQGNSFDVKNVISEKKFNVYFHMFSFKYLATGAFILDIIIIADNKSMDLFYRRYK